MSSPPETTSYAADLDAVRAAAERIAPYAHRTPVLTSGAIDRVAGRRLWFKCENFQKIGAFKFRGATNCVLSLTDDEARRGVVTHSSGNHAQALALAARHRGITAHIVMPTTSPEVKCAAVREYGGVIHPCPPTLADRERVADVVLAETGGCFVHPYNDPRIIAGQGTCVLELLDEVPDLDAIIAPIGGGGLMSGTCIAARGVRPGIRLFAAEPAGADDAARSLAAGRLIPQTGPDTIADGLLTSLGDLTWPIVRDHVERVITVADDEIVAAMRLIMQRMKIVVEPSGAVSLAAALALAEPGVERLGVIVSGGNVDLDRLPW
ncbi:MAG: pyridoxal-phosphate dependent enzyme [Planctomycetes bacterium]|nr:pyridoxal-phosphate dependent enzyme [Planctomycetota bacterium]